MANKRGRRVSTDGLPSKKLKGDRRSAGDENGSSQKNRVAVIKRSKLAKKGTAATLNPTVEKFCEKFKQPEDSMKWLLSNSKMSVEDFFKTTWQKKPLAMHAAEESKELTEIFSYDYLLELASSEQVELEPGLDFYISKDNDVKFMEENLDEAFAKKLLDKALGDGTTVQIMEPHRFQAGLHALLSPLETYLGSLVFSTGYVNPPGGQLRGPHFTDEECFIVQTEGTMTCKIYEDKEVLSTNYSGDFKKSEVGEPRMSVTLKPGDVLYMPRGTVNECVAGDKRSSHITIRTYQRIYWANYFSETLPQLIELHERKSVDLRRGLPLGFLPRAKMDNKVYADYLIKLAESIRADSDPLPVAEGMLNEFMSRRMPPFGLVIDMETEAEPTEKCKVQLRHKGHFVYYKRSSQGYGGDEAADEEDNKDSEEDIDLDESELVLLCSVRNDLSKHGLVELDPSTDDAFAVDTAYEPMLKKLLDSEEPVALSELKGTDKDGKPLNTLMLVKGLFNIGAVKVVD